MTRGLLLFTSIRDEIGEEDEEDDDSDNYSGSGRGKKGGGRRGGANGGGASGRNRGELLTLDPKRVKRILANRLSAARSKERRVKYTLELEAKVQALDGDLARLSNELESTRARAAAAQRAQAEADGRALGLQQVLAHASAANQALAAEVRELQRCLGLPEQLPSLTAPSLAVAAPGASPPQSTQAQQDQHQQQPVQQEQQSGQTALVIKQQQPALLGDEDGDVEMLAELLGVTGSPLPHERSGAASGVAPLSPASANTSAGAHYNHHQPHQQLQVQGWLASMSGHSVPSSPPPTGIAGRGGLHPPRPLLATLSEPLGERIAIPDEASTTPSWSGMCTTPAGAAGRASNIAALPPCLQAQPLLQQQPGLPHEPSGSQPLAFGAAPQPQRPSGSQHQRSASAGSISPLASDAGALVYGSGMAATSFVQLKPGAVVFGAAPLQLPQQADTGGRFMTVTTPGPAGTPSTNITAGAALAPEALLGPGAVPLAPFGGL
jgi:hypothetical protein